MPQERYNTEWVQEHGLGVVGRSLRKIRPEVDRLLAGLDQFRHGVRLVENRAVFEVPQILAGILGQAGHRPDAWRPADHAPPWLRHGAVICDSDIHRLRGQA
jgi:hypothetical protein